MSYQYEGHTATKSWFNVPYNYFYVVFYFLLGAALAINPVNQTTQEIMGSNALLLGKLLAVLFLVAAFVLWRKEPTGDWTMVAVLPGVVWGAFHIVNMLGQDSASWDRAVFIGAAIALLLLCAEQRLTLQNNETVNEAIIKENIILKAKLASLETPKEPADEQRASQ